MSRLIDADLLDITEITTDDYSGNEVLDVILKEDIDDAETVKGIPIERMEKKFEQIISEIQSLRGCSCSCSDGIIDDVEDIIDKIIKEQSE